MKYIWTKTTYHRTASGKGYSSIPASVSREEVDRETYDRLTDPAELRFWNGFCGGTCRASYCYTAAGYRPYRITRQNPTRTEKVVDELEVIA